MPNYAPYIMTLSSAVLFSFSTIIFTHFSRQISPLWMNTFKAIVAFVGFSLLVTFVYGWHPITHVSLASFLVSGFFGLGSADVCLFIAFTAIGPARTLMVFGFAPVINGVISYFLFDQELSFRKLFAIVFMILCLLTFSYERYKKRGHWEVRGLLFAVLGVSLDCLGIILSRYGFDQSPQVLPVEGNFYRCIGALITFFIFTRISPIYLWQNFYRLKITDKGLAFLSSFLGTFLSLWLFLSAIQIGHLATISAIAVTAPFLAALFETIFYKEKPSQYLLVASCFFIIGFSVLFY